jgi:enamine deaminase RidA (YjgF/YER057c/UK114 family)
MTTINEKIESLGIKIPQASAPVANYVGFVKSGNQIIISGQLPLEDGKIKYVGKVGGDVSVEDATEAAKLCAINIIAQLNLALDNDLEKIKKCVKLGIFVNAIPEFTDHPKVANGASDLIVEIFQEKGKHARAATGAGSLPLGAAVEIDAIFEI